MCVDKSAFLTFSGDFLFSKLQVIIRNLINLTSFKCDSDGIVLVVGEISLRSKKCQMIPTRTISLICHLIWQHHIKHCVWFTNMRIGPFFGLFLCVIYSFDIFMEYAAKTFFGVNFSFTKNVLAYSVYAVFNHSNHFYV